MNRATAEQLKGNTNALILAALREGPLHGYAIARHIESQSESYFRLNEGSLYPALHQLEKDGALTASWEQVGGRRRKRYRLTRKGRALLARLVREWQQFSEQVGRALGVAA